jgi:uncharacterized protein
MIDRVRGILAFLLTVLVCSLVAVSPAPAGTSKAPASAPAKHDWVVDKAKILSAETIRLLTQQSVAHQRATTNQFVILTVDTLGGWSIEDYAKWIGNNWGIGQKSKNNGVLLLVAPNERRVRIAVGFGLENVLTDAVCQSIINNEILPYFKKGRVEEGVINGAHAIVQALGGKYVPSTPFRDVLMLFLLPFLFIGRLFGFGGGSFTGGGGSFGGGGASGSW